jgi:predicted glutamine amidotransferase
MGGVAPDGWGVAFYAGYDVALFREPAPAAHSPLVQHLEDQGPRTHLAISHIRHATRGAVTLANTQPFVRELGGQTHVFAHNGHLPGIWDKPGFTLGTDRPVGETDSEQACCVLLGRMRGLWRDGILPPLSDRLALLERFAAELRTMGPANFLYADGDVLFAHGHRRIQRATGKVEPPGLWML